MESGKISLHAIHPALDTIETPVHLAETPVYLAEAPVHLAELLIHMDFELVYGTLIPKMPNRIAMIGIPIVMTSCMAASA